MTKKEFKTKMQLVYKTMKKYKYVPFSCMEIHCVLGNHVAEDYHKLIGIFLHKEFIKNKYQEEMRELRMLLLKSFELEVLRTKRYLEY